MLLQTDVLSRDALQRMAEDVQQAFGALDIFFANAGIAYVTPLATTDEAQYDRLMDTNVKSVFFSIQAVEPIMKEGGSIILNTAWLNQVGVPGRAMLSASKAAVRSLARTLSAELLGRRIRVNAVSPGLIETPILRGVGQSEHPRQTEEEFRDYLLGASKLIPIGRLGQPEEIAAAVLFLASDASSYMLGSETGCRRWIRRTLSERRGFALGIANRACDAASSFGQVGRRDLCPSDEPANTLTEETDMTRYL